MLTGFNTDVRHGTVVLHVQTEDKGSNNPTIESLVYLGGQILERRRSDYRELLDNGSGTEAVVQLMEQQHRDVIERIRRGHLDERLVSLGVLEAEPAAAPEPEPVEAEAVEVDPDPVPLTAQAAEPPEEEVGAAAGDASLVGQLPAEEASPTLDQVILDYLSAEADEDRLVLLMDAPGDLKPGREAILRFETRTSLADEPVPAADVRVRMISTSREPMGLARGETDAHGHLELRVEIPALAGGAAALIVSAKSRFGDAELKHLI